MNPDWTQSLLRHFSPLLDQYVAAIRADRGPRAADRLQTRLPNEIEALASEALVWRLLRESGLNPVCEPVIAGDCRAEFVIECPIDGEVIVEVATILAEPMHRRTGFDVSQPCAFSYDNKKVSKVIGDKADQLRNAGRPAVVFLASHSMAGGVMFDEIAAEEMLTGKQTLVLPLRLDLEGEIESGEILDSTCLESSLYLRRGLDGSIVTFRREISAVVLVDFDARAGQMRALIHPDPLFPIDPSCFSVMPVGRIKPWPIMDHVRVHWAGGAGRWPYPPNTVAPRRT